MKLIYILAIVGYVVLMVYRSASFTLGNQGFDSIHYLSMTTSATYRPYFGWLDYGSGFNSSTINTQYDFQSFYYFAAFIEKISAWFLSIKPSDIYPITTSVYIWVFSILYFTLNILLIFGFIAQGKLKSKALTFGLFMLVLIFFGSQYYNSVFAFFGNTYRMLLTSFVAFFIYQSLAIPDKSKTLHIILSILVSALIAVSSSGFFIGAILFYAYVATLVWLNKDIKTIFHALYFIGLPILEFTIFYVSANRTFLFILIIPVIMFYLLWAFFKTSISKHEVQILKTMRLIILWIIPLMVFSISLYLIQSSSGFYLNFFENFRAYDMVWYLFDFSNYNLVINGLSLIAFFIYIWKSKSDFKWVLTFIILTFINPISIFFLEKFMAGPVYYRTYEVVFNPLSYIVFFAFLFDFIKIKWLNRILLASFIISTITLSVTFFWDPYHSSFLKSEQFDSIYKLDKQDFDLLNVMNTKIKIENLKDVQVVSQFEQIIGYLPNIQSMINYNDLRNIDKYSVISGKPDLFKIFYTTEVGQVKDFDVYPDYSKTCDYLINERVDFIIVRKDQNILFEGQYVPLFFVVRPCASKEFENDRYLLYRLYW